MTRVWQMTSKGTRTLAIRFLDVNNNPKGEEVMGSAFSQTSVHTGAEGQ